MSIPKENEYQSMAFHPYNIMLTLVLFGVTMLFFGLSASYIYTRVQFNIPPIRIPILFLVNTVILMASSYTMILAKRNYLADDTEGYQRSLIYTIILSVIFMVSQFYGWYDLFVSNDIAINHSTTASYLYLISFVHFAHVIAGLPFLIAFLWVAYRRMKEPVSVLVYFSDPEKQLKLNLLTRYWHFLDILWIYLVVFFYVNYFITW